MVKKFNEGGKTSIKADVIVLGCTLPGIVTAHKLKTKFGDSMDIMVIDLPAPEAPVGKRQKESRHSVAFQETLDSNSEDDTNSDYEYTTRELVGNVARFYLRQYAREFAVPLPDAIMNPEGEEVNPYSSVPEDSAEKSVPESSGIDYSVPEQSVPHHSVQEDSVTEEELEEETPTQNQEKTNTEEKIPLQKLFQYPSGNTVKFLKNLHDFEYLTYLEKFELNQYHTLLDSMMRQLFLTNKLNPEEDAAIFYNYDQTSMEKNILDTLLFSTSREIMRIIVRLVCGAPANNVSLLFYLHQCYRTSSARNHIGGMNTRFREKLLGHCRKHLSCKLQKSIADIKMQSISIKEIRTFSEQVIIETIKGETTYICSLLAMALRPDQLNEIQVERQLLTDDNAKIAEQMVPGRAKKFSVKYKDKFWGKLGYSGDIFSMRGPIIWAMERPRLSTIGNLERYSELVGFLMTPDDDTDSKEAVLGQLVNLFGLAAANPVSYRESLIADLYVPSCGDYVALRRWTGEKTPKLLEWGALDIFADGDVAAALEAGHTAYLHMLAFLRPQAQSYDDIIAVDLPFYFSEGPPRQWLAKFNIISGVKMVVFTAVLFVGVILLRSFIKK